MIWFHMADRRERFVFALLYAGLAFVIALGVHALMWGASMGHSNFFNPGILFTMVGPALLAPFVCAGLFAYSPRFATWRWVACVTIAIFMLEQAVFWAWYSRVDDSLGFAFAFYQMSIFGGFLLAPATFAVVSIWRRN